MSFRGQDENAERNVNNNASSKVNKNVNKTDHSRTNSYFDNPDRKKETDFTEVLNLEESYEEIVKETEMNPTDTQVEFQKKAAMILEYRRKVFYDHLEISNQRCYIELNKNLMNFCRDSCFNINSDNISDKERECLKNCSYKYLEQFNLFNGFKESYEKKFGTGIFLFDKQQRESLTKLVNMIKFNHLEGGNL